MYSFLVWKSGGLVVDSIGISCGQCEIFYTHKNIVVNGLLKTYLVLRAVYSAFYTPFLLFSDLMGGAFYTLSTGPITITSN